MRLIIMTMTVALEPGQTVDEMTQASLKADCAMMVWHVRPQAFKSPPLKVRLASVMGILIRHATYITDAVTAHLSESGLVGVLCEMVQDKSDKVRRRAAATLGELLFYIATQDNDQQAAAGGGGGSGTREWEIPSQTYGVLVRCFRPGEDEVVCHYAAKAVENIATAKSCAFLTKLATLDTVVALCLAVFGGNCSDSVRATAVSVRRRRRTPVLRHLQGCVLNSKLCRRRPGGSAGWRLGWRMSWSKSLVCSGWWTGFRIQQPTTKCCRHC